MNTILLNKTFLFQTATKITESVFAIIGLIGIFAPLDVFLSNIDSIGLRITFSLLLLLLVWLIAFLGVALSLLFKSRYKVLELLDGFHVYVQYGDILTDSILNKSQTKMNLVIPVNRCFDTVVDDDLISSNTLHGMSMLKIYESGAFTAETLNEKIQGSLAQQEIPYINLSPIEKRSGNLKRYEIGAVAEIQVSDTETYFFLGLSKFDKRLRASTSDEELILSLSRLISYCGDRSQQFPIITPLIGTGLARTGKTESEILRLFIEMIKLYKDKIHSDVYIVIGKETRERIALANLLY